MVDQVLGGDIADDVIEEVSPSITDNFQGVSEPHHDFFKQEGGSRGGVILPGWSGLNPFGGIVSGQNDISVSPGTNRIDRANKINSPFLEGRDGKYGS